MKPLFSLIIYTLLIASTTASAQVGLPAGMNLKAGGTFARPFLNLSYEPSPAALGGLEKEALRLVNQERSRAGLGSLAWNEKVAEVARSHSKNMAEYNFFSHKGLDGTLVDDRARILQMGKWQAIGENIAFLKGFENPVETAVEKWLRSSGHRGNMLDPRWTETAIGLAVSHDGKYYFTQVFIRN